MIRKYSHIHKINEGGNAFDDISTFPGSRKIELYDICNDLLNNTFGFPSQDFQYTGSFRHKKNKGTISDVDVVIAEDSEFLNTTLNNFEDASEAVTKLESLAKKHNIECNASKGIGVLSIKVPVKDDEYLQMDIIPVPTLEWGTFSYYSPEIEKTQYKGLYRNALFEAIAKAIHFDIEYFDDDRNEDNIKSYYRYRYMRNLGLMKVKESRAKITTENFTKEKETYELITYEPKEVVNILLGRFSLENVDTFDKVFRIVRDPKFKHKDLLKDIFTYYEDYIVQRQKKELPDIVIKYMEKL